MYKVALGAVLLLFIHMWVKEVLREEENNEKRKEGLLSIISTDGELQKQIDIIRKYRHDIPKHIHMMEETIDRDIMEKRFCDNELLNAIAKIKEAECRQKNISIKIDFKLEKDAIEKINLSAIKVSGLIQNLLDNAIEENCRITDLEEREIKWTILQADFGLKMQIKNACLDIDKIDFETKKEEKSEKMGSFGKKNKDKKHEQIEDLNDRLKRQMAEFDNFRKRTEKEKAQMFDMGARTIIDKILPVIDNFERGLAAVQEEQKDDAIVTGMHKVYNQKLTEIDAIGVKPIEALGKEFDPDLHNAVMQVESEEYEPGIVAQELQKGYTYKDNVVRHSMVAVVSE